MKILISAFTTGLLITIVGIAMAAVAPTDVPSEAPLATIDLGTKDGAALVQGQWRYSDTKIVETEFRTAGADGQPGSQVVKTYDYEPKAGSANFEDSKWEAIAPTTLEKRRSNGHVAFNWYRINLTIPQQVAGFDTTNSTVVFDTSADDYAEIWVLNLAARLLQVGMRPIA
jgi:gluconolactonase